MSTIEHSLYEYDLPLNAPLHLRGGVLEKRNGMIVIGADESGNSAYGEIAPLPYFSTETFPIAKEEAVTIARSINEGKSHAIDSLQRAARSVAFGFDSVLQRLNQNEPRPNRSSVVINALLTNDLLNSFSEVSAKRNAGFHSFKVKVGMRSIEKTIAIVKDLHRTVGDECDIRLDANRSLSTGQAVELADKLAEVNIEYFEEPVGSIDALRSLMKSRPGIRLALDESLLDSANDFLFQNPQITAFAVKPTILGPFRTRYLIEQARKLNKNIVISSSFESPVGIAQLARLAASLEGNTACGLDTLSVFANDPFGCSRWIQNGRIRIEDLPEEYSLSSNHFRKLV